MKRIARTGLLKGVAVVAAVPALYLSSYLILWERGTSGFFAMGVDGICRDLSIDYARLRVEALRPGAFGAFLDSVYSPVNHVLVDRRNEARATETKKPNQPPEPSRAGARP